MNYFVVKIGGSQHKVLEGDELLVEKIEGEKGKIITFNEVLLSVKEDQLKIGKPYLKNTQVEAEIVDQVKGKKIRVATYKAKSRYRRVKGHRKKLTKIRIKRFLSSGSQKRWPPQCADAPPPFAASQTIHGRTNASG